MHDLPHNADLLAAVAAFLRDDAGPALEGSLRFQARVAANVVDIVKRELEQPGAVAADENRRLEALLGVSGDTPALTRRLCERIAAGKIDAATPGLADTLWFSTCCKLAVDQPRYAGYRRALAERAARDKKE